ncbi:endonuclease/exonuclease/phosphatase family protein [Desertivirga brevis]|uniref:endonuclease/exonuclease/phosphatase family protein n=1 Tax=Desertivirga brevis TaxID=2810310 RepID=UPI001A97C826|nr:endonuclease/exonuclease/phosphatase family protein [Pedobacter sp. SYSU D00873]
MKKVFLFIFCLLGFIDGYAQSKKQPGIRVASYNLRYDTPADSLNAWPHRKENVKALIQYHGFDIIGTQEGLHHQVKALAELPGFAYFGAGRDDGKLAGEHSAILYKKDRFAMLDSGNFWLRETPAEPGKGWDADCCNRICSWAKFSDKSSGKKFYVFNVHFDHRGVVARRESGKLMLSKIKEIAKDAPVICTGDFNSTPDTEQIKTLSSYLQDSYVTTQMPPYGPVGTFTAFKLAAPMKDRIDYVFLSKDFLVKKYAALTDVKERRYPSDHLPVVVDVEFVR